MGSPHFPDDVKLALKTGFAHAEKDFLEMAHGSKPTRDDAGSCALVVLLVGMGTLGAA